MRPHETWRFLYYTQPLLPGGGTGRAFDASGGADGALALQQQQQQQQQRPTDLGHLDITWRS
ncbi:unnamed protein product, partial [Dibothriocephalus latus]